MTAPSDARPGRAEAPPSSSAESAVTASEPGHEVPTIIRTNGRGQSVGGDSDRNDEAAAIDLGHAALQQLGRHMGLGNLRTALIIYDDAPIAISGDGGGSGTITVLGRRDQIPGALLAFLRRTVTEGDSQ